MADDMDDDFMPLSITGMPKPRNHISLSQATNSSRLSRSFSKSRKKSGNQGLIQNINGSCASSVTESVLTISDSEVSPKKESSNSAIMQFCPTCQAPFDIMKINPQVHAHHCKVDWDNVDECPIGEMCYNDSVFHYRDYSHSVLAQIRASKGHLPHELTPQRKNTGGKKQFKTPNNSVGKTKNSVITPKNGRTPLNCSSEKSRGSSCLDQLAEKPTSCKKDLFGDTVNNDSFFQNDFKSFIAFSSKKSTKNNVHQSKSTASNSNVTVISNDEGTSHQKNINCTSSFITEETVVCNNKHTVCNTPSKNEESTTFNPASQKRKCNVQKCNMDKFECNRDCDYSRELKLDAVLEYKHSSLNRNKCRNVETSIIPCNRKEESHSGFSDEVKATMSVRLSPTDSIDRADKLKTPVKVDASCSEAGWETVEIAALPDAEVGNVTLTLCECSKSLQVKCSVLQNEDTTKISDVKNISNKDLEQKFFKNVSDLVVPPIKREHSSLPNHQMSITSYFQTPHQPILESKKISVAKNTQSNGTCVLETSQGTSSFVPDNITTSKEMLTNATVTDKPSQESVVAHWKKILPGMARKGKSSMNVMSDDSLSLTGSESTSAKLSESSQEHSGKKSCPSYKRIPETSFVVDAFNYGIIPGISHYCLSHFHYDHYIGLKKSFSKLIICSRITAALVKLKLHVDEKYIRILEMDEPTKISNVIITALDANHCPGSVMFLFQLPDGRNFLHVGDFRADPKMESYPCFWNVTIHKLYLDTTYCEPRYNFPMQSEIIGRVVELAVEHYSKKRNTLFVCASYTIGKEKVFLGIVEALGCKLWTQPEKRKVLECINNPLINERLTNKQWEAQVHVCPMHDVNIKFLEKHLKQYQGKFSNIVAFIPTGWEIKKGNNADPHDINVTSYNNITIYGVPYSEHSSFSELKRFVQFLKPSDIIPTVNNGHPTKRAAMKKYFQQWLSEPPPSLKRPGEKVSYVQQKMARYITTPTKKTVEDFKIKFD